MWTSLLWIFPLVHMVLSQLYLVIHYTADPVRACMPLHLPAICAPDALTHAIAPSCMVWRCPLYAAMINAVLPSTSDASTSTPRSRSAMISRFVRVEEIIFISAAGATQPWHVKKNDTKTTQKCILTANLKCQILEFDWFKNLTVEFWSHSDVEGIKGIKGNQLDVRNRVQCFGTSELEKVVQGFCTESCECFVFIGFAHVFHCGLHGVCACCESCECFVFV